MSRTDPGATVCHDFDIDSIDFAAYDVRTILFAVTAFLVPGYILLSLMAVLSRHNKILKQLASHGKTSTTEATIERGKSPSSSWCWVSKRCFAHFYFTGILSTFFTTIYHLKSYSEKIRFCHIDSGSLGEIFLIRTAAVVLLVIHIIRRAYECMYIQQYRDESSKMHIAGYALGVGHYAVIPLVFWDIDATRNNSAVDDSDHSFGFGSVYSSLQMPTTMAILVLGISGLNVWLQYEQNMHHQILADIRRLPFLGKKLDDQTKDWQKINIHRNRYYSLPPYRRWFRYVLSPHYLAEVLLYLSFAAMIEIAPAVVQNNSECENISSNTFERFFVFGRMIDSLVVARRYRHWMLFVWVTTNLTVSAMNNHDWYNSTYNEEKAISNTRSDSSACFTGGSASHQRAESLEQRTAIFPKIL